MENRITPLDYDPELSDVEMAITEKRVHTIESDLGRIAQRVANLEGHREASAAPRQSPNAALVPVLSILGIAVVGYWAWIGLQVVDHGKKLTEIYTLLAPQRLGQLSSDAASPNNAKIAENIIATARQKKIQIPLEVVERAGHKFIYASDKNPEAWNATVAFLDYRSFLNSEDAPAPPRDAGHTRYVAGEGSALFVGWQFFVPIDLAVFPEDQNKAVEVSFTREMTSGSDAALSQQKGFAGNAKAAEGPKFIWIDTTAHLLLDNGELRNVVIRNATIVYRGKPISLKNVYFVNCTFDVARDSQGQAFADAILTQASSTTFNGL